MFASKLKSLVNKLRLFLLRKLTVKQVIGLKLEGITIEAEKTLSSVHFGVMTLEGSRRFASISAHYMEGDMTQVHYDDLEKAQRDYNFLLNLLLTSPLTRKAKKNG